MNKVDKAIEDISEWISKNISAGENIDKVVEMTTALAQLIHARAVCCSMSLQ